MIAKNLSDFYKQGVAEDVIKMSFMHYEERRKLKVAMLEEFDIERTNMKSEGNQYLYPGSLYSSKR